MLSENWPAEAVIGAIAIFQSTQVFFVYVLGRIRLSMAHREKPFAVFDDCWHRSFAYRKILMS